MNRTIKFRGLRTDGKGWSYGYLQPHSNPEKCVILQLEGEHDWIRYEVFPNTIGQNTGLTDKNGQEIYEGDKVDRSCTGDLCVIEWRKDCCKYDFRYKLGGLAPQWMGGLGYVYAYIELEIVGNIHEQNTLQND